MKITAAIAYLLCLVSVSSYAQGTDIDALVDQLQGENAKQQEKQESFKTRGFKTRGITPPAPEKQIKTRSLYVSRGTAEGVNTRGAKPMKAFFGDPATTVSEVTAPAYNPNTQAKGDLGVTAGEQVYKVEYQVDPTSAVEAEVFFQKGSAELRSGMGSLGTLSRLATAMQSPKLKDLKFVIEGHASADGHAVANKNLSQLRANAIHDLLIEFGVSASQIFPAGYGEDEARFPVGSPEKSLEQDRRVLIYKLES